MIRQITALTLVVLVVAGPMPLRAATHPHSVRQGDPPPEIFDDGFESGVPSAWSSVSGFALELSCNVPQPARGPVGSVATIFGSGFVDGLTEVRFNGVPAVVQSFESGQIEAVVPAGATTGPVTVRLAFSNVDESADCGDFEINNPPDLAPLADQTAPLGQVLTFSVTASDPDGDPLALTVAPTPLPLGASFDGLSGLFVYEPRESQGGSTFPLTFTASDGNLADSESMTLSVPEPSGVTSLAGVVLTTGSAPLVGVRLVYGEAAPVETFSQADGSFLLPDIPFAGENRLLIDGSTAVGFPAGTFATVPEQVTVLAGAANVLPEPIFLLPLDLKNADPVDFDTDSMVDSGPILADGKEFPPVEMMVEALSATSDGKPFDGMVSITQIPSPDLGPMPLPDDFDLAVYIAVQPFGVEYDPPADLHFPNVEGFPTGAVVEIFGLNHDTGEMEKVGDGIVEPDGMIHSGTLDPDGSFTRHGVVTANSWHGFVPRPAAGAGDTAGTGDGGNPPDPLCAGSGACPRTGDLSLLHGLASYRSAGAERGLLLTYHSQHAAPHPVMSRLWTAGNLTPAPQSMSTRMQVAGVEAGPEMFFASPSCAGFNCPLGRFSRVLDATGFATGIYPAELTLSCNFEVSRRDNTHTRNVQVVNQIASPFGAGWSLMGLERLHPAVTGDVLLTDGRSEGLIFTPALRATAEITQAGEQDFYEVTASRGETISLRMKRRSSAPDGSGSLDPALELRDSRGFLLASDQDGGPSSIEGPGSDARILAFTLPATDTYRVVARGSGGTTGPYHLFVTTASSTAFVSGQSSTPSGVDPAFVFDGAIQAPGEQDTHGFAASAGTLASLELVRVADQPDGSGTLDPLVELRDSQGFLLYSNNDGGTNEPPGPGRNALIASVTLPATDTYSAVARGAAGTTGPYQLRVTFGDLTGDVEAGDGGPVTIEPVVLSPAGEFSTLTLNADGSATRRMTNGTVKTFDASGLLTRIVEPGGATTEFSYDAGGRLTTITDPAELVTTLVYGGAGLCPGAIREVQDPAGRTTLFEHDAQCNLLSLVAPGGAERRFEYDDRHLLIEQVGPRGVATPDPDDFTTSYEYDFSGRFLRSILPDGSSRELVSDQGNGLLPLPGTCDAPSPDPGCPGNLAPVATQQDLEVRFVDAEERLTVLGDMDALGRWGSLTSAAGVTGNAERDVNGRLTRLVHPTGHAVSAGYDEAGNLSRVTDELFGATVLFLRDGQEDRVTSILDSNGGSTTFEYGAQGNLLERATPLGRAASFTYTPDNRIETLSNPDGVVSRFDYDPRGHVQQITEGVGTALERVTSFTYTADGKVETITDPMTRVTTFEYDAEGRVIEQTFPDGRSVTVDHDADGNFLTLTPPGRGTHYFTYDERGRNVAYEPPIAFAGDPTTTYTFNRENQLTSMTLPDGRTLTATYDEGGRTSTITTPRDTIGMVYDSYFSGLLTRLTHTSGGTMDIGYFGTLPVSTTWSGEVGGTVAWSFDVDRRITRRSVNGSFIVDFSYDADGLLVEAGEATYERDPASGRLTGTEVGTVATEILYDGLSQVSSERMTAAGSDIYRADLTRDALGRITQKTETVDGSTSTLDYTYDLASRLLEVRRDGALSERYTYDANGNRLSATTGGTTVGATVDEQDRLLQYGQVTYGYNENGDLLSRTDTVTGATTTYDYDVRGALRNVTLPGGTAIEYVIDAGNRRIGKKVGGVLAQGFLYGNQLEPVAELDGQGQVVARFVYASSSVVPDYMIKNGVTYRVLSDQVGSPRLVVDTGTGAVVQRLEYSTFGEVLVDTNPGFQPFGFAGGLYDPDTGLVRFGARDYDPETGRWTSKDPIGFAAFDPNLYGYAFNDPVNLNDPSGQIVPLAFLAVAASPLGRGIIGAVTAFGLSAAGQLVSNLATGKGASVDFGQATRAAGFGFVGGVLGPAGFGAATLFGGTLSAVETGVEIALMEPCERPGLGNAAAQVGLNFISGAMSGMIGAAGPKPKVPVDAVGTFGRNLWNEVKGGFDGDSLAKLFASGVNSTGFGLASTAIGMSASP